jgi:hypothetical protein
MQDHTTQTQTAHAQQLPSTTSHPQGQQLPQRGGRLYTNVALTAIAGLLAIQVLAPGAGSQLVPESPRAYGQVGTQMAAAVDEPQRQSVDGTLVSAGEQRKQMIAELRGISQRMERLESAVRGTLTTKVVELPAGFQKSDDKK